MSDREYEIEVFRAGTPASKGITEADIAAVVAAYDFATAPAPVVEGHPDHDKPAKGIIKALRQDGPRLFATLSGLADDLVEGIRNKRWLNRSFAFWHPAHPSNPTPGKLYAKHLGFLGAAQPAIAGMEPLKFSADEATIEAPEAPDAAVVFALEPTPVVTVTSKGAASVADEITFTAEDMAAKDAEIARLRELADQAETNARTAREADNAAFCDSLVTDGKLPPAHKADLVAVFNALPAEPLTFAEDRTEPAAAALKRLLGGAKPVIQFGATVDPDGGGDKGKKPKTADEITKAALAFQAEQKGKGNEISFDDAVEAVGAEA